MRSATLFLIAILTPCAVLCWMTWRSMKDEAGVIKGQRTAFYQQSADNAARTAGEFMTGQLRTFGETVDRLLESPDELRPRFHQTIRGVFPLADAGFIFDTASGRLLPQTEPSEQMVTEFIAQHAWFFSGEPQPLYLEIPAPDASSLARRAKPAIAAPEKAAPVTSIEAALESLAPAPALPRPSAPGDARVPPTPKLRAAAAAEPAEEVKPAGDATRRTVQPQFPAPPAQGTPSQVKPVVTTIAALIARHEAGIAGSPRDEGMFTLLWYQPPDLPGLTFAVALQPAAVRNGLARHPAITAPDTDTFLAILDHARQPVAQWKDGGASTLDTRAAPFVAREIGSALPRWEAAVFLRDPAVFTNAASGARWQLGLIVTTASLVAIAGALFILRDARRAARDARLKTDFVSNVSHELKTPLTSIRMFSDLLGHNPAAPPEKTKRYAEVIAGEAARLTRLINNVLNFSRMEGGRDELQIAPLDLRALTEETIEHMRPQLEQDGFTINVSLPENPVTIRADADALSQVLLNLLGNAAKYGHAPDSPREITVTLAAAEKIRLTVADRGPGVPRGHERRIFEKFQRAHDTLASGTAGSGLGLTIARRLVEAHGGTLDYAPRDGGGAEFIVTLTAC